MPPASMIGFFMLVRLGLIKTLNCKVIKQKKQNHSNNNVKVENIGKCEYRKQILIFFTM